MRGVEVWLSVVDVRGAGARAAVRLGLDGPPEAVFTREELLAPRQKEAAGGPDHTDLA